MPGYRGDGAGEVWRGDACGGAAARSEEEFQKLLAIFNHGLDAVLLADDEMQYLDANPSASALLGYSRHELMGLRISDLVAAEHRGALEEQWNAFLSSGIASVQRPDFANSSARVEAAADPVFWERARGTSRTSMATKHSRRD